MADDLPPGFTVDRADELPPGFTVDPPRALPRETPALGPELAPHAPRLRFESPLLSRSPRLDTAASVDEAVAILRGLRLASSRSLMLCDTSKAAYAEVLGDEVRVVGGEQLVHTNHFLHPDLAASDELNVFARNSSLRRLAVCEERLATLPPAAAAEDHLELLSAAPIRVAGNGDIRRERTVAAVVMRPAQGELQVRPGDPALSSTQVFTLG